MTSPADLQAQADALHWYHTIDLGNGVVTKGDSAQDDGAGILPDVPGPQRPRHRGLGRQVLLSGRAGRGAEVVALDHYAWGVDLAARGAYWAECIHAAACCPTSPATRRTSGSPTCRAGAGSSWPKAALGSKVEPLVADFQSVDLAEVGRFDVVLYLGVLYHMKEPLTCLDRVRAVTKEVAVIETEAVHIQGHEGEVLLQFHAGSSLRTDFGNWYVPTIDALHNLCRAAGFSEVRTIVGPPPAPAQPDASLQVKIGRRLAGVGRLPLGTDRQLPRRRPRHRLSGAGSTRIRRARPGCGFCPQSFSTV